MTTTNVVTCDVCRKETRETLQDWLVVAVQELKAIPVPSPRVRHVCPGCRLLSPWREFLGFNSQ